MPIEIGSAYGDSDERFKVQGGADRIAGRLARRLPAGAISLGTPLVGLRRNADRSYTCMFAGGREVRADRVVLALPFTTLREVDYRRAGFSRAKDAAIRELGMATNAKLTLQSPARRYPGWRPSTHTSSATSPAAPTSTPGCTTPGRAVLRRLPGRPVHPLPRSRPGRPRGGVHFAGEHTDTDQEGYIDRAVRSGERAARELLA